MGCLDRNNRGGLLWKVYLQVEIKKGENVCLSLHGAFHLGPKLLHGSNGQFLMIYRYVQGYSF
jgi:hypothetical protein